MPKSAIAWLRNDLRIADNPALTKAMAAETVAAAAVDETVGVRARGGASRWWLHHSLEALAFELAERGVKLEVASGDPLKLIPELCARHDADAITWNRRYGPAEREIDGKLKEQLKRDG